jgi:hypothetical protein
MTGMTVRTFRTRAFTTVTTRLIFPRPAGTAIANRGFSNSSSSGNSYSSSSHHSPKPRKLRPLYLTLALLASGGIIYAKSLPISEPSSSLAKTPLTTLIRSYAVWTLISFPSLVDASPALLDFTFKTSIPLIPTIGGFVIRNTFFRQFIPGETAEECLPGLQDMRRRNVGHALNYSAEGDTLELGDMGKRKSNGVEIQKTAEQRRFEEVERALEVQGEFERQMEQEGWAKGSSAFALKVVSQLSWCLAHIHREVGIRKTRHSRPPTADSRPD